MAIVQSLLLGSEGSYQVCGGTINFSDRDINRPFFGSLESDNFFVKIIENTINSYPFRVVTFSFFHFFVHETGHVVANNMFSSRDSHSVATIYTKRFMGRFASTDKPDAAWKDSFVFAAGSIANMVFSCCHLMGGVSLAKRISRPLGYVIGGGGAFWMAEELAFSSGSAIFGGKGEFAKIASNGTFHVLLALAILVSACALGVYASVRLAR